ncbi:hypothetical protein O181_099089 [Austropuccinia psidii MF-1]|uniref:Helicase ATP-binding domain-containing protein n=1 Tax=Austropuccinia psidii MF-1 TaxID=1389203 RepID=A0A9Q3JCJ5_9BASI|nr:hypothetical protein [Austropuccinia psidii MF-1]
MPLPNLEGWIIKLKWNVRYTALMRQTDAGERQAKSIAEDRKSLPVDDWRDQLFIAVAENGGLIFVGETRSQRTTQHPQYLNEGGYSKDGGKIGHTQPRRVAEMLVAARVGDKTGVTVGDAVGYAIPFEDCPSPKTVINYMMDGMFLRDFMTKHDLAGYTAMIFDEAHKRRYLN